MKHVSFATVLALATFSSMAAPELPHDPGKLPPASTQNGLTFDKDIHPMFDIACVRCHGEQRPKAGLRVDTLAGVLKGSRDHQEVVPGHSDQSRLIFAVAEIDGKIYMPPRPRPPRGPAPGATGNGPAAGAAPNASGGANLPAGGPPPAAHPWKPLTPAQVGLIRAWIDQGAK
jgi:hypothetical protein